MSRIKKVFAFCFLFCTGCTGPDHSREIDIVMTNPKKPAVFVKLPAEWKKNSVDIIQREDGQKILALYLVEEGRIAENKVTGNYIIRNGSLVYVPYFDLSPGLTFEIQYYYNNDTFIKRFETPQPVISEPLAEVASVYPLTYHIPANILAFHIIFSAPMLPDEMAFSKIQLKDEKGHVKPRVWKEKSFWVDNRHLVLMIHPGRIKRDIAYMDEYGPVFIPGQKYTLLITDELTDQFGRKIFKPFKKTFKAIPDDRMIPKVYLSRLNIPKQNSFEPLVFEFSEPMDFGLVLLGIEVSEKNGRKTEGQISATNQDTKWKFTPANCWQAREYQVAFNTYAGDLANNYLHRPFETTKIKGHYPNMPIRWNFKPVP